MRCSQAGMSHSLRACSRVAVSMADRRANGWRFLSLVKLTTCIAAAGSCFDSRAGDFPELTGSRYGYDSWPNVQTGFGLFFPDEAIARCRTSGVGVEDPDWFYVKMTFKF